MPAIKRSNETLYDDEYEYDVEPQRNNQNVPEQPEEEDVAQEEQAESDDDDGSPFSSCSDRDEFVLVNLAEVRKEVQCPICLGIIRKTRTVMECLHRFCRECIDKSMRLGNNECPACRAHCASRRSLRDDPNYDALIAVLYPEIDKYEEEELAFREDEQARNKQIQASLDQTSRRQLEALGKKRATGKATAAAYMRTSQGLTQSLRGRRSQKSAEPHGSDDGDNDGSKDSSSTDEPKQYKRTRGARSSLPSSSADGGCDENEVEATREILAWGRGGIRSHTRHGGVSGSANKKARKIRITKLIHHLQMNMQNDDELDIHLKLVSLDEQNIPNSQYLYLCCTPTTSIKHICEYVALENGFQEDEIELLMVKGDHSELKPSDSMNVSEQPEPVVINPLIDELQLLEKHQKLLDLANNAAPDNLTLAYRKKSASL